jgi:virginiamycin B lyase
VRSRLFCGRVAVALLLLLVASVVAVAASPNVPSLTERERYGFVATSPGWPQAFDVGQLRAGWYVDATQPACAPAPEGMRRAALLHVHADYAVDPGELGLLVDNHPGGLWLVGNEPDCIWQDNVWPEEYAHIYHDVYTFIKGRDPTSRVSPGGIVQPTPLRLQWLDRALAEYETQYGQPLPVDVWNIHNAILNEQQGSWGADIPPGIDATEGVVRAIDDNDNLAIFTDQIWTFRQWMADNGYGGYPLIVTEYGILMPDDYGFGVARVSAFMTATFDFFENTTDPTLGDPTDGNRLVQRWAWFSLDVQPWDPLTGEGFNGNLFDPETVALTAHGQHYASRTAAFPSLAYIDLEPGRVRVAPASAPITPTQTLTRQVAVEVVNSGTLPASSFAVALAYNGPVSGTLTGTLAGLEAASSRWLTFTLSNLPVGGYDLAIDLDPGRLVSEASECNNSTLAGFVVPRTQLYLPVISRQLPATSLQLPASNLQPLTSNLQSNFEEFSLPTGASYPAQIALDAQGRAWITERDGTKIARFDPSSQTWQEYAIPTANSQPWGLALSAAGNVWFAESAANQIAKLTVATGEIAEYAIPTANSQPWGLAVGLDGVVWFTEKAANQIGKFVPATQTFTEYAVPTADSSPTGIAVFGSYAWFTEAAADKIARLDSTTGGIIAKSRPAGSVPQDLVLTSAGKPWFTEVAANRIVLFDPSTLGWVLEVNVATANSEPYGITTESDSAIWFTERAGNRLGRFTSSVPPLEYPLPTPNSQPTDLVVDDGGCVWYVAPGANLLGRLCPPYTLNMYLPIIVRN